MTDLIVIAILVVMIGAALAYIIREKKRGRCIGCPDADRCHARSHNGNAPSACGGCTGCSGCGSETSACGGCHPDAK